MPAEGEGGTQTQAEVVWPAVIQGGMGIQVSSWKLARQVALHPSGLGIVSATCMEAVLARRLQNGDVDDVYHRALASFPDQAMAKRVLDKYFVEGGKAAGAPYKSLPMWTMEPKQELLEVTVLANYCEVWLAKHDDEGHLIDGVAGINLLTKVQLPTIASLYGAVLAAADYVIMGAGIPMEVPKILDELAANADTKLAIDVGGSDDAHYNHFSPAAFWAAAGRPELVRRAEKRPAFIPIVSSVTLAMSMLKRAKGAGPTKGIQGFVIEMPTAGGHNAPPRGFRYDPLAKSHVLDLNDKGEPVYGPKDDVDLKAFAKYTKGLPFWLAGYYARPEKLQEVVGVGAAGIQVGTSFAFAEESGYEDTLKQGLLTEFSSTFSRLLIAAFPKTPKALSARGLKITVPWYPFARPTLEENGGHAWRLDAAGL